MCDRKQFPLISGFLSLDLVNTEIISHGRRRNLLVSEQNLLDWLHTMCDEIPSLDKSILTIPQSELSDILSSILELRFELRKNFESIADGYILDKDWVLSLEQNIKNAPFIYKLESGILKEFSTGEAKEKILSLISLDVLRLIDAGKLQKLKRCSNPDCVLLFIDLSGRRKWCSMKICGNRQKVARFQDKKQHN
ncbi:CGNR zinc finger domain-containing protein [Priestia megaterium]|nr:CGNR zinc finger domain-containing protein [Priestia megaterium]